MMRDLAPFWTEFYALLKTRPLDSIKYHVRVSRDRAPDGVPNVLAVEYASDSLTRVREYAALRGWPVEVRALIILTPAQITAAPDEIRTIREIDAGDWDGVE